MLRLSYCYFIQRKSCRLISCRKLFNYTRNVSIGTLQKLPVPVSVLKNQQRGTKTTNNNQTSLFCKHCLYKHCHCERCMRFIKTAFQLRQFPYSQETEERKKCLSQVMKHRVRETENEYYGNIKHAFDTNECVQPRKEAVISNEIIPVEGINLQTTVNTNDEEKLIQKVEIICEVPVVEAEKPKVEEIKKPPKVLQATIYIQNNADNPETRVDLNTNGNYEFEVASKCDNLKNVFGQSIERVHTEIDDRLLPRETGKFDVPQTQQKENPVFTNKTDAHQCNITKESKNTNDEIEINLETRVLELELDTKKSLVKKALEKESAINNNRNPTSVNVDTCVDREAAVPKINVNFKDIQLDSIVKMEGNKLYDNMTHAYNNFETNSNVDMDSGVPDGEIDPLVYPSCTPFIMLKPLDTTETELLTEVIALGPAFTPVSFLTSSSKYQTDSLIPSEPSKRIKSEATVIANAIEFLTEHTILSPVQRRDISKLSEGFATLPRINDSQENNSLSQLLERVRQRNRIDYCRRVDPGFAFKMSSAGEIVCKCGNQPQSNSPPKPCPRAKAKCPPPKKPVCPPPEPKCPPPKPECPPPSPKCPPPPPQPKCPPPSNPSVEYFVRRVHKNTKSTNDSACDNCEICRKVIEYVFGSNEYPYVYKIDILKENIIKKLISQPKTEGDPIERCNSIIIQCFSTDETAGEQEENTEGTFIGTEKQNVKPSNSQGTKDLDEVAIRLLGVPKVDIDIQLLREIDNCDVDQTQETSATSSNRKGFTPEANIVSLDEIARRCLNYPHSEIDNNLIKEIEKLRFSRTTKENSIVSNHPRIEIIHGEVMNQSREPVKEIEVNWKKRNLENDEILRRIPLEPPEIESNKLEKIQDVIVDTENDTQKVFSKQAPVEPIEPKENVINMKENSTIDDKKSLNVQDSQNEELNDIKQTCLSLEKRNLDKPLKLSHDDPLIDPYDKNCISSDDDDYGYKQLNCTTSGNLNYPQLKETETKIETLLYPSYTTLLIPKPLHINDMNEDMELAPPFVPVTTLIPVLEQVIDNVQRPEPKTTLEEDKDVKEENLTNVLKSLPENITVTPTVDERIKFEVLPNINPEREINLSELLRRVRKRNRMQYCQKVAKEIEEIGFRKISETEPVSKRGRKRCPPSRGSSSYPPTGTPDVPPTNCRTSKSTSAEDTFEKCCAVAEGSLLLLMQPRFVSYNTDVANYERTILINLKTLLNAINTKVFIIRLYCAKDYEPWTPIPSWPIPEKITKRPFQCPKDGCKPYPPPKINPPSKEKPCTGFPKRNYSLLDYLFTLRL